MLKHYLYYIILYYLFTLHYHGKLQLALYIYKLYPSQSVRDTSIAQESRRRLVHYSGRAIAQHSRPVCATFTAVCALFVDKDNRVLNASGFASME